MFGGLGILDVSLSSECEKEEEMEARVTSLTIPDHGDDRGNLIALEGMSDIVPFEIKRIYYSFDTQPGSVRGNHAHKNLRQFVVCLSGGIHEARQLFE